MEGFFDSLTQGNVTQVKTVLASVIMALAFYQLFLMAIGYRKVKSRLLKSGSASFTHRAVGDTILVLAFLVALMCFTYFDLGDGDGDETRLTIHAIAGTGTIVLFTVKVIAVRWGAGLHRFLPMLGFTVFALLAVTWFTSAGDVLFGG
ncbi:MAG: DUF6529 family protein [Actinomycetota bacterium]